MSFCTLEYAKSQTGPTFSDGTFLHWERFMLWKYNFLRKRLAFSNSPDATRSIEHDWSGQFLISRRAGCRQLPRGWCSSLTGLPRAKDFRSARLGNPNSCSTLLMSRSCWRQFLKSVEKYSVFLNSKQYGLVPAVPAASWSSWGQDPALQYDMNWHVQTSSPASRCTDLHFQSGVWCQTL